MHFGFDDRVADERSLAPGGDNPVPAQNGELLGNRRLRRTGAELQLADRHLAPLHRVQQLEPEWVAEALDDARRSFEQHRVDG